MNQVYEGLFKDYANYPEFRIWRMMVRIWNEEVFCKLEKKINSDFLAVLNAYLNHFGWGVQKNEQQMRIENINGEDESIPMMFLESAFDTANIIGDFYNSIIDVALNERTVFNLTCQNLLNFSSSSNFCTRIYTLIKERCHLIIDDSLLNVPTKAELLINTSKLVEGFLPKQVFPQIFELIIGSLQSVFDNFVTFSSQLEGLKCLNQEEKNFNNWLHCELSDSMSLAYPSFRQHVHYYKKKLSELKSIHSERESKITKNALRGFNLSVCELEKTFMDFNRKVDLQILEECRTMCAN
eukprot:CAMPEP_0176447092 /NCGR_PEP_ID=MMETSP0127-20121128/24788_1 /TAXON_ID=938130 /ORGANISM="Platyophrya macrostoma, Strain WH" /LENGTH=295 /DNA_ID=CAMNT_0017833397 /DNA_START=333 /DNA_END=1220 /DNA_ORIENTATION=-